ncbi:hypothetical protein D9619_007607 [Psilocybe cf. subviscida]|uniref:Uncharacterized protein n=1 Tax=Psilocybe cf. subviscida TaxID=2480587 RepID=A0A8H5B2U9_9AGAR|nr:hypothetical protein D9619_007607 [Psilocybe cf. subviscida]
MAFLHFKRVLILLCLSVALGASAAPTDDAGTSLTKRETLCKNTSGNLISEINSSTCVSLLEDIGGQACSVSGTDVVMFMQVGDAAIFGINALGSGTVSSSCNAVAAAAQNIINACTNPNTGLLQGRTQVSGNPNLVVMIDSSHSSVPPCNPCF